MDASKLKLKDEEFDLTVCYNAIGHLTEIIDLVLSEMLRVTQNGGQLIFIATWAMDKRILEELQIVWSKRIDSKNLQHIQDSKYSILIIKKLFDA
jgi:ubiquinone/menaquinone biosynthesis C-methylase UbiE